MDRTFGHSLIIVINDHVIGFPVPIEHLLHEVEIVFISAALFEHLSIAGDTGAFNLSDEDGSKSTGHFSDFLCTGAAIVWCNRPV